MSLFESASLVVTPNGTKASKLYAIKPTSGAGDLTVVRNTTATRVNSSGLIESVAVNVPRLDYTNSTCPSILVEPQRTNILTYSNDFANGSWGKNQVILVLDSQLNPEGVNSTYKITNSVLLGDSYIEKINPNTVGTYTTSVFIKNIGNLTTSELMSVHVGQGSVTSQIVYNWNTNTFTFGGTNAIAASAVLYANGYVRLTFTYSIGATVVYHSNRLYANGDSTVSKSALIYGFQTEVASYPTSYIPTVASAVTRNADVISKTGISSLIGQTEGTMFVDFVCNGFTDFGTPFCINDGSTANSIWITTFGDGTIRGEVFGFSNVQATFSMSGGVVGQRYKLALVYKQNDFAMYVNGNLIGSDTSGTVPSNFSRGDFDYTNASVFVKSALEINTAILWKTRLTNAELAELTTL